MSYISDSNAKTDWKSKNNLSSGIYEQSFVSLENKIKFNHIYKVKSGPSDILSRITNIFLGRPTIENKPIATLLQYNIVYLKIGIVTIIIALFVLLISPFIKKLMHGIH